MEFPLIRFTVSPQQTRKNLPHVWTVLGSYITEARADEVEIKKFIVAKQN
jgi:hypothetical protein